MHPARMSQEMIFSILNGFSVCYTRQHLNADRCLPGIWLFSVGQQVISSVSHQEDERKDNGEKGLRITNTMLLWQKALKKIKPPNFKS